MIKQLSQVLSSQQVTAIIQLIEHGNFENGKDTAGWHAKEVKNNLQWQGDLSLTEELEQCLLSSLTQHPDFSGAAYAKAMMPFIISESTLGGGYGDHIDDALMVNNAVLRTDLSCTIFLSPPEEYQGGELVMNFSGVEMAFKLNAGDAIIYPSTTLHRVNPVTSGSRKVALTWIESHIPLSSQREILCDLDSARKEIMNLNGKTDAFDKITKTHANLLRQWAVT
ncbi:Fe2+-dependent dioxygenase [Pseudoalteromonas sp. C2R02]|uniref:Fe2+-dependent dioxygenase n=1 Tax=Pseudoalteromonas sp. C2R02 TaxID=2841565 RepID=UPI001C08AD5C|nr:Fe2+-dependent dioxygenase [Pseudoalteromonas sp. C2R02]MBU2972118.1 Fe2+-dependent dioxygenase [Pseudoalteromonas sp. C2R02]